MRLRMSSACAEGGHTGSATMCWSCNIHVHHHWIIERFRPGITAQP